MGKSVRILIALAFVVGLTPSNMRAESTTAAGCLWTYDGCICSPFGACQGVNCNHNGNGTDWCLLDQ